MKTQIWNNIKMNVSCSAIQQMLHYPVNMAIGILNFSLWFLALFFLGGEAAVVFIRTFSFFFLKNSITPSPSGMQGALVIWVSMHSNVQDPHDVTWLQAGGMGFVPTGHRPIKSRQFYQAGDNAFCLLQIYSSFYAPTDRHRGHSVYPCLFVHPTFGFCSMI